MCGFISRLSVPFPWSVCLFLMPQPFTILVTLHEHCFPSLIAYPWRLCGAWTDEVCVGSFLGSLLCSSDLRACLPVHISQFGLLPLHGTAGHQGAGYPQPVLLLSGSPPPFRVLWDSTQISILFVLFLWRNVRILVRTASNVCVVWGKMDIFNTSGPFHPRTQTILPFLSSKFHALYCAGLSLPWLNLFLSVVLFLMHCSL